MTYSFFINNLPAELVPLINSFCCPETDYYRDKILKIADENGLTRYGFNSKNKVDLDNKGSILNIMRCKDEIPFIFRPLKTVFNIGSYGGKHEIEQYRNKMSKGDSYIANGEFIIAMILNDYVIKRENFSKSPNCRFRGGELPIKKIPKLKKKYLN